MTIDVCNHGNLRRQCQICDVETALFDMRERAEKAERELVSLKSEVERLRELVRGQDDGGHWYSQATMDAVVKQRDTLINRIDRAPVGTVTQCDLTTDYPTWKVEDHRIGVTLDLISKRVALVLLDD